MSTKNKTKVMIIDDDSRILEMYQAALEAQDYDVVIKPDGTNAIDFIKKEDPDLIILDVMIPNITGLDILDMIKASPAISDIRVIILSALSDDATKEKAAKYGASAYLVKSEVTMSEVIVVIKKLLNN